MFVIGTYYVLSMKITNPTIKTFLFAFLNIHPQLLFSTPHLPPPQFSRILTSCSNNLLYTIGGSIHILGFPHYILFTATGDCNFFVHCLCFCFMFYVWRFLFMILLVVYLRHSNKWMVALDPDFSQTVTMILSVCSISKLGLTF